jgi:hypothetical protein
MDKEGELTMGVDVDEAWRHHIAGGIDSIPTSDRIAGDDGDLAVLHTDVGDRGIRIRSPTEG